MTPIAPIAPLISSFLREHMPIEQGCSPHTLRPVNKPEHTRWQKCVLACSGKPFAVYDSPAIDMLSPT
jgi:hypothetical protein